MSEAKKDAVQSQNEQMDADNSNNELDVLDLQQVAGGSEEIDGSGLSSILSTSCCNDA